LLIGKGANVNSRDKLGRTPLRVVEINGYEDIADVLRQHGGED
jgi:ankyrin repeat protein